jgi:hypothetical protein
MDHIKKKKLELLNYNELVRLSFDDINKRIVCKSYINNVKILLNEIMKKVNTLYRFSDKTTKVFLISYLILFHSEIINDRKDDFSKKISLLTLTLISSFEDLFKDNLSMKSYEVFHKNLLVFFNFFEEWKKRDALILVRPMLETCLTIDLYVKQLKKLENKEQDILDLERQKKRILTNIKIMSGEDGLKFYKKGEVPYFVDEKIFTDTEKVVRRAFWDVFEENLDENKYTQVPELLKDIKNLINNIVKNEKFLDDFNNNIDIDVVSLSIDNNFFVIDNVKLYMYYLIRKLTELQQPSEDKNTKMFLENINEMINKNTDLSKILRYFFENYFQKLEKIKYVMSYINKNIKIETI